MKEASLSIIKDEKNNRFLMIHHHRGINKGFVNFPGGKREPEDKDMFECVKRETKEETGLTILNPKFVGYIEFSLGYAVSVFISTQFEGTLCAKKDELDLFWQSADDIPYDQMRSADADFLPDILSGHIVKRRYAYDEDGKLLKKENIV